MARDPEVFEIVKKLAGPIRFRRFRRRLRKNEEGGQDHANRNNFWWNFWRR